MGATRQKSSAAKNVLIFFIVFIILEMLVIFGVSKVFKNKDVTPSFAGYSLYLVDSNKMGDKIPQGSLVIAVNGTPSVDKISSAVLCEDVADIGTGGFWLCDITSEGDTVDGVVYTVCQETNAETRYKVKSGNVIGVATNYYTTAGKVISFLCSSFGKIICAVVPLFFLVLIELIIAIATHSSSKEDDDEDDDEVEEKTVTLDDFLFGGENEGEQIAKHLQKQDTMLKKSDVDAEEKSEEISEPVESEKQTVEEEPKKEKTELEMSYYEKASKLIDGDEQAVSEEKQEVTVGAAPVKPAQRKPKPRPSRPVHTKPETNASLEDLMKLMEQEQSKLKEKFENNSK